MATKISEKKRESSQKRREYEQRESIRDRKGDEIRQEKEKKEIGKN